MANIVPCLHCGFEFRDTDCEPILDTLGSSNTEYLCYRCGEVRAALHVSLPSKQMREIAQKKRSVMASLPFYLVLKLPIDKYKSFVLRAAMKAWRPEGLEDIDTVLDEFYAGLERSQTRRHPVLFYLSHADIEKLRNIGKGNVSKGVTFVLLTTLKIIDARKTPSIDEILK